MKNILFFLVLAIVVLIGVHPVMAQESVLVFDEAITERPILPASDPKRSWVAPQEKATTAKAETTKTKKTIKKAAYTVGKKKTKVKAKKAKKKAV